MKISVASGKGGTGKTFFSTNLFAAMKRSGHEVVMIDCDAEVPDDLLFLHGEKVREVETRQLCPEIDKEVCRLCGQCAQNCAFNAITCIPSLRYITVHDDLCHGCGACVGECPYGAIRQSWKTVGEVSMYAQENETRPFLVEARMKEGEHSPVPVIRHAIREADLLEYPHQILDAPPGCTCPFVNTVMDADLVILVAEPTPFGCSDLKHTVNILRELEKRCCVVINRSDIGSGQLKNWLSEEKIPILLEIPYSDQIARLYSEGLLAIEHSSFLEEQFEEVVHKIMKDEVCSRQW